jgi:D-alanine-D-alanine ligase
VLMGGRSAEREVSLNTGSQVSAALYSAGFDVIDIDTGDDEFVATLAGTQADVAFICLHGRFGEDGTVQGLCELLELPYIGSGVLASALAIDKVKSKQFFEHAGLQTPDYAVLHRGELYEVGALVDALGEKTVVKPAGPARNGGQS